MATYNGHRWISTQLESILKQLGPDDEVVIVDDSSKDDTLEIVRSFGDKRIRIFENATNLGVDRTFERAIGLANGETVFLSDQDDLWLPTKVERVMHVLDTEPGTTLVLSDALIIDAAGASAGDTYFESRGRFIPGVIASILKSKFLGCAIAFRSRIRDKILPFPHPLPGHDMWIGTVNELYGRTHFISEPLMCYRRHGQNLSPSRHQGILKMLAWRWQLVSAVTRLALRQRRSSTAG